MQVHHVNLLCRITHFSAEYFLTRRSSWRCDKSIVMLASAAGRPVARMGSTDIMVRTRKQRSGLSLTLAPNSGERRNSRSISHCYMYHRDTLHLQIGSNNFSSSQTHRITNTLYQTHGTTYVDALHWWASGRKECLFTRPHCP